MRNTIIKINDWYDNLNDTKRYLIFLFFVIIPVSFGIILLRLYSQPLPFIIIVSLLAYIRMSYKFFKS